MAHKPGYHPHRVQLCLAKTGLFSNPTTFAKLAVAGQQLFPGLIDRASRVYYARSQKPPRA
nr:hypothetical protein [Candidatus Sigynarchaeum springense]